MAKKKYDYRAAQARRNNQQKMADAKAKAREKEFIDKYGKKILIGVAAAIVLIVAIWLGCKWFVGPGGSIPNWFGTLRNVEEDWIITNTGTNANPRYYKFAEFTAPEGYTLDPTYNISGDDISQTQYYLTNDESSPVETIYVAGVRNLAAAQQLGQVLAYYENNTGVNQATIAGHDVFYSYIVLDTTVDEMDEAGNVIETPAEKRTGAGMLCIYTDTIQSSSVLVMLTSAEKPIAEVVSQDTLLAEAEKVLANLTVEK